MIALLFVAGLPAAKAQYPDKPVKIVVPVAAGGGVDVMARLLALKLTERLNQQFVVENRPGAAGVIGSKAVIASPADGATLLYTPALLPDMPTMNEAGLPGFAVGNWAGLLGPAGLDPKIVAKLNSEIIAILGTADVKERVRTLGFDVIASTPQQFAKQLQEDVERWGLVAKAASGEKK